MLGVSEGLAAKIRSVRLVVFDVDGVLTDGRIIFSNSGEETKFFDVKDGHGMKILMRMGIDVAIITARQSEVVRRRAADLGITHVFQGMKDKRVALEALVQASGVSPGEMAYMGDDIIDLPVMKRVAFSAAVSDAVSEVIERADYVAKRPGGRGAARELAELILKVQGKWDEVMKLYLA
ncbi:3-deoxy-D-manno-octulosonate 8-phosphate phosphatase (KDO 8-P phosphatase) [uncultured bacterium]|nr:3-deoxy-D-manno-octulosonate 8-phosphate phosphatase (KDO 8-P phosphatase) [uncultured bacterium]